MYCIVYCTVRCASAYTCLEQVSNTGGHFHDLSVVECFNILQVPYITLSDEIDGNALSAKTTRSTNSVDVILSVGGEVIVDD